MNYPNMSYCQCENTLLALHQVIENMNNEGPGFLEDMSRSERRAFQELFYACEQFLMMAEELEDQAGQDRDGQPDEYQEWHDFNPDC